MKPVHVRAFYPADPVGVVPGGVDTFLRGILKYAPDDLRFSLVGMTTDEAARPCGRWTRCQLGQREFDFFPVVRVADAGQRSRIPLSLRYTAATALRLRELRVGFDVFEFHRIEPVLLFLSDARPKNAFFHQDMAVIRSDKADIVWRHMPGLYFSIERRAVNALSSAWCVRQEGVRAMHARYPSQAEAIRFVPTWVDTEVFSPLDDAARQALRMRLAAELGLDAGSAWVISVGRLDSQKDPELMLAAVARLVAQGSDLTWLVVGDGVLRAGLERRVADAGLQMRVRFLGLKAPAQIADLMRAADVFALSSAYEGMPMAALEALGSGLPVATTDVGEVRQVVRPGLNGSISADRSEEGFAACLAEVLAQRESYRGEPAVQAIKPFQPAKVLAPVFDTYRQLGRHFREQAPLAENQTRNIE
ncbi:glycosyltransferase family 4 protein [Polaromonas hydrogenivorans]|uniref:Glycosyltransferase family 4 protein n=1 Tax=Polaromonas hydrogenivorans TaxID=335476 RepID=A0AAU7LU98_9BURK